MDDRAFESLARQVAGRPEHPGRRNFESERRRRQSGPDRVVHEAWLTRQGVVRANSSNTHDELFTDYAIDGKILWMLSPAQLTISGESVSAPDAPDIKAQIREAETTIAYFLSDGKSIREALPVGSWTETGRGMIAEGQGIALAWQRDASGQSVVSVTKAEMAPEEVGRFWTLSGHAHAEVIGMDVPRIFEEKLPSGRLERRVLIDEIRASSRDEIGRVTKRPPLDGRDEVRGQTTFVAIFDYRGGAADVTVQVEGGTQTTSLSQLGGDRLARATRTFGWIAVIMLVVALVFVRIRQSRS
jgi:hypothetical protein